MVGLYWIGKVFRVRNALMMAMVALPVLALGLTMGFPIIYTVVLSFGNMDLFHFKDPTFSFQQFAVNIRDVFTRPIIRTEGLWIILARTFLWTGVQTSLQVVFGFLLALCLNAPIRFKRIFQSILILPWAIPSTISLMTLRMEFHPQFGFINGLIETIFGPGTGPPWWSNGFWNFVSMNLVNLWLGVPFMMVLILGALQGVDRQSLEAAEIDGAGRVRRLFEITIPLISPTLIPAVIMSAIYSFNNFGVPYFMNPQELETSQLLSLAIFRTARYLNRYSFSSALALVNTGILMVMVFFWVRRSGVLRDIRS
ncbi:carbohydrate ABC transporter permease [Spirochaeta lutea]|uniref:carbohydrate ABC transporter permease n=1 Tax=Spirochaeta lutea TaxID=1480694 RepID=UPI001EE6BA59|nr:sugar ABC transporter permease [Spirochaeta lutea]